MQRFDSLAGVPCYYAKTNASYGDISKCKKSRVRKLRPAFLRRLESCIAELKWLSYGSCGVLEGLVSGGAWVPESDKRGPDDRHVRGIAFDLGGVHWGMGVMSCWDVAQDYHDSDGHDPPGLALYIACEAVLRRSFGTVLGIVFNRRHWNHYHLDTGTRVGFWTEGFGSNTRIEFLQLALRYVWGLYNGRIDGIYGKKTKVAIKKIRAELSLGPLTQVEQWKQFLLLTAMAGFGG